MRYCPRVICRILDKYDRQGSVLSAYHKSAGVVYTDLMEDISANWF